MQNEEKISRNRVYTSYIVTVISMAILLFFIGIVASAVFSGKTIKDNILRTISIDIQFQHNVDLQKINLIQSELKSDRRVFKVSFTSAEDAFANTLLEGESMDSILMDLDNENPMPPMLDVSLHPQYFQTDSLSDFTEFYLEKYRKDINEIHYPKAQLKDVMDNLSKIGYFGLAIAVLIGFVSVMLINNTIKLSMYSNRFMIKTMQLVGATDRFIQGPFLRNAIIQAFVSGLLAFSLILGLIYVLIAYDPNLTIIFEFYLYIKIFVVIFVLGMVMSIWFTYFAVRKYTKTNIDKLY
jgi:cell division transport system permease protein